MLVCCACVNRSMSEEATAKQKIQLDCVALEAKVKGLEEQTANCEEQINRVSHVVGSMYRPSGLSMPIDNIRISVQRCVSGTYLLVD